MTLLELQNILGKHIEAIDREDMSPEQRKEEYQKSESVARLAKQMINNADVVLRTDKLIAEGKLLKGNTISKIVGSSDNE
jgi:hypothetical protein|nr:MAG TPA: hypothetical protein [Caudoviricetes sp.]